MVHLESNPVPTETPAKDATGYVGVVIPINARG